jgi:hypothetical protein
MPSLLEQLSSLARDKNRAVDWTRTLEHEEHYEVFFLESGMHSIEYKGHSYAQKLPKIAS